VSPVKYELGLYIPEDDILHSHRRENIKSYIKATGFVYLFKLFLFKIFYLRICCKFTSGSILFATVAQSA
jgi:hypothetical protein